MTEPTATRNPSLIARLWALPKRFTAAFILSILLFLWVSLAGGTLSGYGFVCQKNCPVFEEDMRNVPLAIAFVERVGYAFTCGGIINGEGWTGGKPQLPLGTICVEQESSIGPADILESSDFGAYSPADTAIALGFALFLVAQMALAFAFAALKERGIKVSARRRLLFHIFLPTGLALAFAYPVHVAANFSGHPTMVVQWPLWILISVAMLIIARRIVDRKAPVESSSFVGTLRQAFLALLPAIAFWFIRNAILPFSKHSYFCELALDLIYFFLFTAGFAWLFMAACPKPQTNED